MSMEYGIKMKNKQNNNVDNLGWCDRQYNIEYSKAIKVNQYDKNGNFIKTHKSIASASRELNIKSNYHISYCCKGKEKSCGGYIWEYYDKGRGVESENKRKVGSY